MNLPQGPERWAIHLSNILKAFQSAHGIDRFPIDVATIAQEYSRQVFPQEPITLVQGMSMTSKFEGMLIPSPHKKGEWGIFYNESIRSKGRKNFTLAHELGHYLLHRHQSPQGLQCTGRNMLDWKSEYGQIEAQANTFSSYLLMPLDDFREQIGTQKMSLALVSHLSDRYAVSMTAAILKWLSSTKARAMVVVSKDGFIDWSWSSDRLIKSGVFFRARQQVVELPQKSLAARKDGLIDNAKGVLHPKGVWSPHEEVHEMVILDAGNETTISLLIYPDDVPFQFPRNDDEEYTEDTYDPFESFSTKR